MSSAVHTEFVGSDWMACWCMIQQDHTREQYLAFYDDDSDDIDLRGGRHE